MHMLICAASCKQGFKGLKIRSPLMGVGVQVPLRAPAGCRALLRCDPAGQVTAVVAADGGELSSSADLFERFALRGDPPYGLRYAGQHHDRGACEKTKEDGLPFAMRQQDPKKKRAEYAPEQCSRGIKDGDRRGTDLLWEEFTGCQVRGAGGRSRKEERHRPPGYLRDRAELSTKEEQTRCPEDDTGNAEGERNHDAAPNRVKQLAKQRRTDEVSESDGEKKNAGMRRRNAVEA